MTTTSKSAVTSTLSRLKNYFIGWHTANYETLHLLTDKITDDENDEESRYAVRSRAIKKILSGLNSNVTTITGDLGTPCNNLPDKGKNSAGNHTVWSNICGIWTDLGNVWTDLGNIRTNIGNKCSPNNYSSTSKFDGNDSIFTNICKIWANLHYDNPLEEAVTSSVGSIIPFSENTSHSTYFDNMFNATVNSQNAKITNVGTLPGVSKNFMLKYFGTETWIGCTQHVNGASRIAAQLIINRRGMWANAYLKMRFQNLTVGNSYEIRFYNINAGNITGSPPQGNQYNICDESNAFHRSIPAQITYGPGYGSGNSNVRHISISNEEKDNQKHILITFTPNVSVGNTGAYVYTNFVYPVSLRDNIEGTWTNL